MQKPQNFEPRLLEYRYEMAAKLLGIHISPEQLREITGKNEQKKSTYHLRYSPHDIRKAGKDMGFASFQEMAQRDTPPLIICHTYKKGSGNTTVSTNLAVALAAQGYRVAFIDADSQASATTLFGFQTEDPERLTLLHMLGEWRPPDEIAIRLYNNAELDFFPADLRLTQLGHLLAMPRNQNLLLHEYIQEYKDAWRKYEFILIDTNPTSALLNFNAMVPADLVLAVAALDKLSTTALSMLTEDIDEVERVKRLRPGVMLIPNRYDPMYANVMKNLNVLRLHYGNILSRTMLPEYAGFGRQVKNGAISVPLVEAEPSSPGARAIFDLSREIVERFRVGT